MNEKSSIEGVSMDRLPVSRWYKAISHRISRRSFGLKDIEPKELMSLREFCYHFKPLSGVRAELSIDQTAGSSGDISMAFCI